MADIQAKYGISPNQNKRERTKNPLFIIPEKNTKNIKKNDKKIIVKIII